MRNSHWATKIRRWYIPGLMVQHGEHGMNLKLHNGRFSIATTRGPFTIYQFDITFKGLSYRNRKVTVFYSNFG